MSAELKRARHRQMFIFLLVCGGMLLMLARLYYWQILQSQDGYRLAQRANDEHIQNQKLNAPRGLIYDVNGQILATNVVRDDVYIMPIQFSSDHPDAEKAQGELRSLVHKLHQVLPDVSEESLLKSFALDRSVVRIAGPIEPAQSQQLRALHLPDVFLEPRTLRIYPAGDLAAQILGFVRPDGAGVYGLEERYNTQLAGKAGSFSAETDLNGNPLTVGASSWQPPVNGANLTLTINSTIQYLVQNALNETVQQQQAQSGTVVVVNVRSGAIVAMAGSPTFDPNNYGRYAGDKGCLNTLEVYFNPALYCTYEPGSTLKAVTMAAALDQGLITPDTTINDPGYITFKDAVTVTNWNHKAYGPETMTQVLEHSANVGAAYVAHNLLGPDRYYPYLERFGFGQLTHIGGQEAAGGYRSPGNSGWTPSDLTRQAFGQAIQATPLQVAMAYQAIANGGVMMRPYLVSAIDDNGRVSSIQPQVLRRVISDQAARQLASMLKSASSATPLAQVPSYTVAVRTGTATTQGISDDQTEASVAGFLPVTNPQFVILVKIDRPQKNIYGSTAAAPLWRTIAQQLMWHYHIPPDRS
ncbi:MAG: penicillin-binding protein 2 [Ktedonobacteraceae bacterium]|nr:penicillin-binding protein 2 [Ktedonobacteraceae bacterium]